MYTTEAIRVVVLETAGHHWEVYTPSPDGGSTPVRVDGVMFRKLCDAVAFADGHGWHVDNILYWQP